MRYETRWRRRAREREQWHVKFALFPREIGAESVWLENYWRRWCPGPYVTEDDRIDAIYAAMAGCNWGYWEYSLQPPKSPDRDEKVVSIRRLTV
jgi:hypothetical protein